MQKKLRKIVKHNFIYFASIWMHFILLRFPVRYFVCFHFLSFHLYAFIRGSFLPFTRSVITISQIAELPFTFKSAISSDVELEKNNKIYSKYLCQLNRLNIENKSYTYNSGFLGKNSTKSPHTHTCTHIHLIVLWLRSVVYCHQWRQ